MDFYLNRTVHSQSEGKGTNSMTLIQQNPSMSDATLLNFPVELFHRIFDFCDFKTILSVRRVCRQFYAVASTYDRFHLKVSSSSKYDFEMLARLLPPNNIISLTLESHDANDYSRLCITNKYTFSPFMSTFDVHNFTRLQSLTIREISDVIIEQLLQHLHNNVLVSLSVDSRKRASRTTSTFVSSIISQKCIRKLYLNNSVYIMDHISWPPGCTLEHLTIDVCVYEQYLTIIYQLHNLQTFVIGEYKGHSYTDQIVSISLKHSPSLSSLVIDKTIESMKHLELLLSHTPILRHLKIVSHRAICDSMFDGYNWEQFICSRLPLLDRFQLFASYINETTDGITTLETLIAPFQTPYWLYQKQWFITCAYVFESETIELYTTAVNRNRPTISSRCEISATDGIYHVTEEFIKDEKYVNKAEACIILPLFFSFILFLFDQVHAALNLNDKSVTDKGVMYLCHGLQNNNVRYTIPH